MPSSWSPASARYCAGGMPKSEKRCRAIDHPAHRATVQQWRQIPLKDSALLVDRLGLHHARRVDTMQPCDGVRHGDETSEQAGAVEVAREHLDAPAAAPIPARPVGGRFAVEMLHQPCIEQSGVGLPIAISEQLKELLLSVRCCAAVNFIRLSAI